MEITIAAITGLVGLMKAWLNYDLKKRALVENGEAAPAPTVEEQQGEAIAEVVERSVQAHGTDIEKHDLASFEGNPARDIYVQALAESLHKLAQRVPAVGQQLQQQNQQAQQASIQVNFTSRGPNYGQQAGVVQGGMIQGGPARTTDAEQ